MSIQPIEGRVISPSRSGNQPAAPGPPPPRTEYVYVQNRGQGQQQGGRRWSFSYVRNEPRRVQTGNGIPRFLGSRSILATAWMASMVTVGFDDWHNNNILPRPSRLWYTSLFFGLLALVSVVDALVPLVNALAIGYTIMLIWNYYNGTGQFASGSASEG
jgi:hypothetical protein